MTSFTCGPAGRSTKALYGAATFISIFCAAAVPVFAARHSHSHHRSRGGARPSISRTITPARAAKVQQQNQALQSGNVVEAATAFQGTRYVFGGTSRSGFDCSGFVRYILGASAGVELPRTAMEQYYNGAKVQTSDLQPGDLVFFKNTYRSGISHVGIYIGDGHFVHACNSKRGVTTDRLDEAYYSSHYAGARRVVVDREASER